ncbi:MAG: hypothetical protein H7288_14790 [Kineosporiaceae bacterium]|nr:hypothetical protein [Aeromicrobium sp.]
MALSERHLEDTSEDSHSATAPQRHRRIAQLTFYLSSAGWDLEGWVN